MQITDKDFIANMLDAHDVLEDGLFLFIAQGAIVIDTVHYAMHSGEEMFEVNAFKLKDTVDPLYNVSALKGRIDEMLEPIITFYYDTSKEMHAKIYAMMLEQSHY